MKIFSRKSGREFRKSPDWMPMCTVFNSQLTQCAQCSTVSWFIMYIVKLKGQCVQSSTGSWFIVYRVRMKGQCVYRVQQSADLMCTELEWKVSVHSVQQSADLLCTEFNNQLISTLYLKNYGIIPFTISQVEICTPHQQTQAAIVLYSLKLELF